MSDTLNVYCEFALSFGVPMLLALRELWIVDKPRGGWREDVPPVPPAPKPLPDCLIPKLQAQKIRELELT
jgi:hypothetical protein